jgi:PAS domain S-box-containing protein
MSSTNNSPVGMAASSIAVMLETLVDQLRDHAVFLLDPEGRVLTWTHAAEAMSGWKKEEITGQHFSRFYSKEDLAAGKTDSELRMAATEGVYQETGWRLRKDGSRYWADVTITAIRDGRGDLIGYGKVVRDVTHQRRAAFRDLVESTPDAMIVTDQNGHIVLTNSQVERIFGYTAKEWRASRSRRSCRGASATGIPSTAPRTSMRPVYARWVWGWRSSVSTRAAGSFPSKSV